MPTATSREPTKELALARDGLRLAAIAWSVELAFTILRSLFDFGGLASLEKGWLDFLQFNAVARGLMTASLVLFTGTSIALGIGLWRIATVPVVELAARGALACVLLGAGLSILFHFITAPSEGVSMVFVILDTAGTALALLACCRLARLGRRPVAPAVRNALIFLLAWGTVFAFGQRVLRLNAFTHIGEPLGAILSLLEWTARYALLIHLARSTAAALAAAGSTGNLDVDAGWAAPQSDSPSMDMFVGGLLCLAGIAVTVATYSSALNGGGRYVVAWGAILYGAIRFFKGLARAINHK